MCWNNSPRPEEAEGRFEGQRRLLRMFALTGFRLVDAALSKPVEIFDGYKTGVTAERNFGWAASHLKHVCRESLE